MRWDRRREWTRLSWYIVLWILGLENAQERSFWMKAGGRFILVEYCCSFFFFFLYMIDERRFRHWIRCYGCSMIHVYVLIQEWYSFKTNIKFLHRNKCKFWNKLSDSTSDVSSILSWILFLVILLLKSNISPPDWYFQISTRRLRLRRSLQKEKP